MTDTLPLAPDPHRPLRLDDDLHELLSWFFPVAVRRQLWTLFLDADDVALPVVVPLEGIPLRPSPEAVARWGEALDAVATEFGATRVVFVLERPGTSATRGSDRVWHDHLVALGQQHAFDVRSVHTCTDDGVHLLAPAGVAEPRDGRPDDPVDVEVAPVRQASPRRLTASDSLAVR